MFTIKELEEAQELIKRIQSPTHLQLSKDNNFAFYDFEFEDTGSFILPISLGMVSKSDELYLVNTDYDWDNCKNEWLIEHVKPNLDCKEANYVESNYWSSIIPDWLSTVNTLTKEEPKHKLVGYYADYDHVTMAQLWGEMIMLHDEMPMWTRDLKQWMDDLGVEALDIPVLQHVEHNALEDARWNMQVYNWLTENYIHPAWTQLQWKK
jgi:hypothetical protein